MDRFLCPWDSPGKYTGVGSHFPLQGIFLTQGSNPPLPHCRQILYQLSYEGSPKGDALAAWTGNARNLSSIPGSGRPAGEGNGHPLKYSCLKNPMDRGVWRAIVNGVARVGQDLATKH